MCHRPATEHCVFCMKMDGHQRSCGRDLARAIHPCFQLQPSHSGGAFLAQRHLLEGLGFRLRRRIQAPTQRILQL